ncbi:MBL fold metallo-hydrolase [Acinetobacter sp. ANC 5502]
MKNIKSTLISIILSATTLSSTFATSPTAPIEQHKQVAGYYQYQSGQTQITALLDGTNYISPSLFKGLSEQQIHESLKKYYADQAQGIQTSINAFLVNTGHSLVLVDSGASSCFGSHLGSVLSNLKASGYKPEQINTILLTHLHPDHVCGISKNGVANFPNATVYVSNTEANYWLNPEQIKKFPKAQQAGYLATVEKIKQAIAPYQAKQRFKTYKLADQIQGFKVISTPGHTSGHFSYELKTSNEIIVFIGDIVHSHTVQFDHPATAIGYDVDPKQAVATRLKQFAEYAKNRKTIAAPHLPFPGIGHIYSADGKSYQWIPVHFKN